MENIGISNSDPNPNVHSSRLPERIIDFPKKSFSIPVQRLSELKIQAAQAIAQKKIFRIYGTCEPVRSSLIKRGWIEKNSTNRLDIRKTKIDDYKSDPKIALERVLLSNFVTDAKPNLIWNAGKEFGKMSCNEAKYNRIQSSHLWTTKLGLCAALKNACWSYIENVAEVNCPRTYACISKADLDSFRSDFKLTACTSLLKWLLTAVETHQKIIDESGTIPINVIVFAVNRCKEYLFQKKNKDLDRPILRHTSNGQWNTFLKSYYILTAGQNIFKPDKDNKFHLFLEYARFILREIEKYRPQLSCEGCNSMWIVKPAHASRGRGIKIASKLRELTELLSQRQHIVQKYIEIPLLIYGTKFDIRQYYLVSNVFPLEIWMYKDSYLKFSSQEYNIGNFHESIHLTNNAVQRKYKNCINRHPKLPPDNMWTSDTFKEYLTSVGDDTVWDEIIYPGMKKCIVGIMSTCQDSIPYCLTNRFELYGCDFILDKNYKPWLIEINSCPDLNPTTTVTSFICPAVISDIIKVVVDDTPKLKTVQIGGFECIHRETNCAPSIDAKTAQTLEVHGYALPSDYFHRRNTAKPDASSNTSIDTQPDIDYTLQRLKINYINKKKPDKNDFLEQWRSHFKYDLLDSRSDCKASKNANTSSNHLGTCNTSNIIQEQTASFCDSISCNYELKTFESVIAEQKSGLLNQIPSDLNAVKRKK